MSETRHQIQPRCQHFGTCGGCQYQDLDYDAQLALKKTRLAQLFEQAGIAPHPDIVIHSSRSYSYRNRIRLRVQSSSEGFAMGYNRPGTTEFLPIQECPISAPLLIQTAKEVLLSAAADQDAQHWLRATAEMELFTNDDLSRIQITLFCAPRTKALQGSIDRLLHAWQLRVPQLCGIGAMAFDPRTGPTGRIIAEAGNPGLSYRVTTSNEVSESYWVSRGGFFQINRFVLPTLVELACLDAEGRPRAGELVWDLYSGVGLFSRFLVHSFTRVVAVESNPKSISSLRIAFGKIGHQHQAIESTTSDFLQAALLQRDKPDLVVLDPPRAGAGTDVCHRLLRVAPKQIVYVSCDPSTLTRDLGILQADYALAGLHLVDLFPQTSHLETIVVLDRKL